MPFSPSAGAGEAPSASGAPPSQSTATSGSRSVRMLSMIVLPFP